MLEMGAVLTRINHSLLEKDNKLSFGSLICLALIGLFLAGWVHGIDFLLGVSKNVQHPTGDHAQSIAGAILYARDEWRLPLFNFYHQGLAQDKNIIFSDSIPVMALLSKLWFSLSGEFVNYFGPWKAICFILLSVSFGFLVHLLGLRNKLHIYLAAALVSLQPAFFNRLYTDHAALCGHFVLIIAFFLYFSQHRALLSRFAQLKWFSLCVLSLLIHPYLFAMVAAIYVVAQVNELLQRPEENTLLHTIAKVCVFFICIVIIMLLTGHIGNGSSLQRIDGYSIYSMNLLSPFFAEGYSGWFPGKGKVIASVAQFEGYNYLGLGVMLALLWSLLIVILSRLQFSPKNSPFVKPLKEHYPLFILALAFTLYAISNRVYFAHHLILSWDYPSFFYHVLGRFRASGRFFWPVGYLIVLVAILMISRKHKPWLVTMGLSLVFLVQIYDVRPWREMIYNKTAAGFADSAWEEIFDQQKKISVFPPSGCTLDANSHYSNSQISLQAAYRGIEINSFAEARPSTVCDQYISQAQRMQLKKGELILFHQTPYSSNHLHEIGFDIDKCRSRGQIQVCLLDWGIVSEATRQQFAPLKVDTINFDYAYSFNDKGLGKQFNGKGWAAAESWGSWTNASVAKLTVPFLPAEMVAGKKWLIFDVHGFFGGELKSQQVSVYLNGQFVTQWFFDSKKNQGHRRVPLAIILGDNMHNKKFSILNIEFHITNARSPTELGLGGDARKLGLGLHKMWFE